MGAIQGEGERKSIFKRETLKQIVCFLFFGLQCYIFDEILNIAAPDILSGSSLATSSILLISRLSFFLVKLIIPWFRQKISYLKQIVLIVLLEFSGLVLVVAAIEAQWRLAGIFIVNLGAALTEITFLAMTAHYESVTVNAFVAGLGFASILGPLIYTGLTTWACVSPRMTVTMATPTVLLLLLFYAILNTDQRQTESQGATYTALHATSDPSTYEESTAELRQEPDSESQENSFKREKVDTAQAIYPYISFLFVVYYAGYLANQAVITTIAFKNSPFVPRDHYMYYTISYDLGKFIGRSHILIASCACPSVLSHINIRRTWILAVVELGHLLFFVLCSWYRFVPHAAFIIVLCTTQGFTVGSMYMHSISTVNDLISQTRRKEFGLGILTVGASAGALIAGLMGLYVEPELEEHCRRDLDLGQLCLTRYQTERGWTHAETCAYN